MHRFTVMHRCSPPCAACDACPANERPRTLAEARRLLEFPEIVLGGGDATAWPALDAFLAEVRAMQDSPPRVWVEAPAASFDMERLRELHAAGVHGVLVQIEGVGEKLLRAMRAGDGERAIADAETVGLQTEARVIARPATFPMVAPLAQRLAPRTVRLELVRRDWGKDPVPMWPKPISRVLLACPNVRFTGYRVCDRGYLPPCTLPEVWAARPTVFRSVMREGGDHADGEPNTVIAACADCSISAYCQFGDRGALSDEVAAAAQPIRETVLPWARMRATQQKIPLQIVAKRRAREVICTTPWTTMEVVDPNGLVRQCCSTWTVGVRGSVNDASLRTVWNGPGYQLARRQMSEANHGALCEAICSPLHDLRFSEDRFRIQTGSEPFVENQLLLAEDIAERREVVRGKPLRLLICPSTYCNYDCIMCSHGRSPRRELPESIWDELPELLPALQSLTLLGGEPLANPSTMRFLRSFDVAKYPDCAIDFVTNGALLTEPVLARLERCTLGSVTMSLNAGTPEVYERVQRGLPLARVLENLDALIRFRARHHRWFGITLSFVVQPAAAHTLIAFGEIAHSRNVRVRLMALNPEEHELDFYVDEDAVAKVLHEVDAFERWASRVRPEWLPEIRAARAAVAGEAAKRARTPRHFGRHLPVLG